LEDGQKLMITGTYGEHKFRPGQMEFRVNSICLLSDVKAKYTKKLTIALPVERVNEQTVAFIKDNITAHSGTTDLYFRIETEDEYVHLKASSGGVDVNDELVEFLMKQGLKFKIAT